MSEPDEPVTHKPRRMAMLADTVRFNRAAVRRLDTHLVVHHAILQHLEQLILGRRFYRWPGIFECHRSRLACSRLCARRGEVRTCGVVARSVARAVLAVKPRDARPTRARRPVCAQVRVTYILRVAIEHDHQLRGGDDEQGDAGTAAAGRALAGSFTRCCRGPSASYGGQCNLLRLGVSGQAAVTSSACRRDWPRTSASWPMLMPGARATMGGWTSSFRSTRSTRQWATSG